MSRFKVLNVLAESYEWKRQIIIQLNVPCVLWYAYITLLCKAKSI